MRGLIGAVFSTCIRIRKEDYDLLISQQRIYEFFILTISLGISVILLDYFINHYFSSDHQWPQRKFYKTMLWLTFVLILYLIILAAIPYWLEGFWP